MALKPALSTSGGYLGRSNSAIGAGHMMDLPAIAVLKGKIQVKAIPALVRLVPNLMNKSA